jgi:hypothetical protein
MLKKILKITGIVLLVLVVALVSIPFLFKDKIKEMVVTSINQNLDATVAFEDIDLSLLKSLICQSNVYLREESFPLRARELW